MNEEQRDIRRKKRLIEYAESNGNVNRACRRFGVARSTFYLWRERYRKDGDQGLKSRRGGPHKHPNKLRLTRKASATSQRSLGASTRPYPAPKPLPCTPP